MEQSWPQGHSTLPSPSRWHALHGLLEVAPAACQAPRYPWLPATCSVLGGLSHPCVVASNHPLNRDKRSSNDPPLSPAQVGVVVLDIWRCGCHAAHDVLERWCGVVTVQLQCLVSSLRHDSRPHRLLRHLQDTHKQLAHLHWPACTAIAADRLVHLRESVCVCVMCAPSRRLIGVWQRRTQSSPPHIAFRATALTSATHHWQVACWLLSIIMATIRRHCTGC